MRMFTEREDQYKEELRLLSDSGKLLARELQRAAFTDKRSSCAQELKGQFIPAPIYVAQAYSIMTSIDLRESLIFILKGQE